MNTIRIRLGVTGHRSLTDEPSIEATVKSALDDVAIFAPNTTFTTVSPLAEGADRLVARVVLQREMARLETVLPLTLDDYLQDFTTKDSRREFQELLAQSSHPIALRKRRIRDESDDPRRQAELRYAAYEAAGRHVVDHSDVLVAIWNGQPSRGRGGTAEIVAYARKQQRTVIRIWDGKCTIL